MNEKVIVPFVTAIVLLSGTGAFAASWMGGPSTDLAETADRAAPDVPERVTVSDAMVTDARRTADAAVEEAEARSSPGDTGVESSAGLVESAVDKREAAASAADPMAALVANRRATVDARAAVAFERAKAGSLDAADVRADAADVRTELERARQQLAAECTTEACLVALAEVQRSLAAADSFLDQVPRLLERSRTEARGVGYAASAVTAARLNVEDARELYAANAALLRGQSTGDEAIDVDARYRTLHDVATSKLDTARPAEGSYAATVVDQARGYLTRAEQRYEDGYAASATVNLMKAILLVDAAPEVADLPAPVSVDENGIAPATVDRAKADAADSLASAIDANSDDPLALDMLELAESRLDSGDGLVRRAAQTSYEDSESLVMGYANYRLAQQISENAGAVSDIGQ